MHVTVSNTEVKLLHSFLWDVLLGFANDLEAPNLKTRTINSSQNGIYTLKNK